MSDKKYWVALLSLAMASPLALASDFKPTFELNKAQLDTITAGTGAGAGAGAAAQAAGMIAASFASTLTFTGLSSQSGGAAAAGAGANAVGTDSSATGAAATTSANGLLPTHTFRGSLNFNSPISSHSGAVEITFVPTLPTFGPNN